MTREDLIRIARTAVAGYNRPDDLDNPVTFDPPEWVIDALAAAWKAGAASTPIVTVNVEPLPPMLPVAAPETLIVDPPKHKPRSGKR